ncbi:hypothetical protein K502DRAFT_226944 [Neoconidiobolus thromboides FSU 785]|nr:hypothetical protein K502DRAFT_226944 [Neoconidiobolus thromboides FSU 785]
MSSINLLLNYTLINEGSLHPSIKYRLKLVENREIKEDSKNSQSNNILNIINKITNKKEDERQDKCKNNNYLIIIHQKITKDLFVDPYQLEQHKEYYKDYFKNKNIGIQLIYSKLDLELPIYEVNDSFVNYFQLLWNVNNFTNKNEIKFTLPLHLRYRKPNYDTRYEIININPPNLSLMCLNGNY